MGNTPAIFDGHKIRRVYDEDAEIWWFSVVDVIQALTQQRTFQGARNYWKGLRSRLAKEGSQSVKACNRLKLPAADGKSYLTDVATAETLLRLVQAVPSPKAEPIKLWLAKIGYESVKATGMAENGDAAKTGGRLAKRARLELEGRTGKKVVSGESFLPPTKRLGGKKKA